MKTRTSSTKAARKQAIRAPLPPPKTRIHSGRNPEEAEADALSLRYLHSRGESPARSTPIPSHPADAPADLEGNLARLQGRGRPLPGPLRQQFERFFQANLEHVRLHQDSNASHLAQSLKTRAFVAGSDIYFANTTFQPETAEGQQLLAHEVTHVLQQNPQYQVGGPAIVRRRAPYSIQRENGGEREEPEEPTREEKIDALIHFHSREDSKLPEKLKTWLPDFRIQFENPDLPKDERTKLAKAQMEEVKPRDDHPEAFTQLAFLHDYFAFLGEFKLAAHCTAKNFFILVHLPMEETLHALHAIRGKEFFQQALHHAYYASSFWPDLFVKILRHYFQKPQGLVSEAERYRKQTGTRGITVDKAIEKLLADMQDVMVAGRNEWAATGLGIIADLENILIAALQSLDKADHLQKLAEGDLSADRIRPYRGPLGKLLWVVDQLASFTPHIIRAAAGKEGVEVFGHSHDWALDWLIELVQQEASRFADELSVAMARHTLREEILHREGPEKGRGRELASQWYHYLPGFAEAVDPIASPLNSAALALFELQEAAPDDNLTRYANFGTQAEAFVNELAETIIPPLYREQAKARKSGDIALADAILAFAFLLDEAATHLLEAAGPGFSTAERLDHQIFIRFAFATRLHVAAYSFSHAPLFPNPLAAEKDKDDNYLTPQHITSAQPEWEALFELSEEVLAAEIATTSQLAIKGEFEHDEEAKLDRLLKDFPNLIGLEPFGSKDLYRFYSDLYHLALIDELKKQIAGREIQYATGIKDLWLLGKTADTIEEKLPPQPERYLAQPARWVLHEDDRDNQNERFNSLLHSHHQFKSFLAKQETFDRIVLSQRHWMDHEGGDNGAIVAWSMPRPNGMIQHLRAIAELNGLVYLYDNAELGEIIHVETTGEGKDLQVAPESQSLIERARKHGSKEVALSDWDWFLALDEIADAGHLGRIFGQPARDQIESDFDDNKADLEILMRKAVSLDRHIVVKETIERLKDYNRGNISTYRHRSAALKNIQAFLRSVQPIEDRELQQAALFAELSAGLISEMAGEGSFSTNRVLVPLLSKSIEILKTRMTEEAEKSLLIEYPASPSIPARLIFFGLPKLHESDAPVTTQARTAAANLQILKENLLTVLAKQQIEFRIQGKRGADTLHSNMHEASPVHAGPPENDEDTARGPFVLDGVTIFLKNILIDFTYFPGIGDPPMSEEDKKHGYYIPPRLFYGSNVSKPDDTSAELVPEDSSETFVETELIFGEQGEMSIPIPIQPNGKPIKGTSASRSQRTPFDWLAMVVHRKANLEGLEATKQVIEAFGEGLMFVLSLTPYGWAVDVAQVIGMVIEASEDPEFLDDLAKLKDEPYEIIDQLTDYVASKFTAEDLLGILLFGDLDLGALARDTGATKTRKQKDTRKKRSPTSRALSSIRRLGLTLGQQLQYLHEKVQVPVQSLRAHVVMRPRLSALLQWTSDNLSALSSLDVDSHPVLGPIARVVEGESVGDVGESYVTPMSDRLNEMLHEMATFEVPDKVFPTEAIVELLAESFLTFVRKSAPGKIELALRIIEGAGDLLGAKAWLYDELGALIKDTRADPNLYYKTELLPLFKEPLETAIHDFSENIITTLSQVPIVGGYVDTSALSELPKVEIAHDAAFDDVHESDELESTIEAAAKVRGAGDDSQTGGITGRERAPDVAANHPTTALAKNKEEEETTAQPALDPGQSAPLSNGIFYRSSGRPLHATDRDLAEQRFGQDLSHVRIHDGRDAAALTSRYRAKALTSGSHIYLDPKTSRRRESGVLHHELAHVVQQTGQRPLGKIHSGTPIEPLSRKGLHWNRDSERQANSMAQAALTQRQTPLPGRSPRRAGFAPAMADIVQDFLRGISDTDAIVEQQSKDEDKAKRTWKSKRLKPHVEDHAQDLWKLIKRRIKKDSGLRFANFIQKDPTARKKVLRYLELRTHNPPSGDPDMSKVVTVLASRNQTSARWTENKKRKTYHFLNVPAFMNALELHILGTFGIVLNFEDATPTHTKLINDKAKTNPSASKLDIDKINILSLNFGFARGQTKDLRDLLIANTWPTATGTDLEKYEKAVVKYFNSKVEIKQIFQQTFDSNEFKFSTTAEEKIHELAFAAPIEEQNVPPASVFVQSTYEKAKTALDHFKGFGSAAATRKKEIAPGAGVQLATHGDFTKDKTRWRPADFGRDSHHTTQFLLPEYFMNDKDNKHTPFAKGRNYPGLSTDGSSFEATGHPKIQIAKTYDNKFDRGKPMPAIFLSRNTHLVTKPSLHVSATADEHGKSAPGSTIHNAYRRFLDAAHASPLRPESDEADHKKFVDDTGDDKVKEIIYQAIQSTYNWMRMTMNTALVDKVPRDETDYYRNNMVMNPAYQTELFDIGENAMKKAIGKTVTEVVQPGGHNDSTMAKYGWVRKGANTN